MTLDVVGTIGGRPQGYQDALGFFFGCVFLERQSSLASDFVSVTVSASCLRRHCVDPGHLDCCLVHRLLGVQSPKAGPSPLRPGQRQDSVREPARTVEEYCRYLKGASSLNLAQ